MYDILAFAWEYYWSLGFLTAIALKLFDTFKGLPILVEDIWHFAINVVAWPLAVLIVIYYIFKNFGQIRLF